MKKRSILGKAPAAPYLVWSVLFIIAPLIFVAYYAFTDKDGNFTPANFGALATAEYAEIFLRSACFAFLATIICLIVAYPIAYYISRTGPKTQKILMVLVMLPMWMNFLIRTYSWMAILEDTGLLNTALGYIGLGPYHMINTSGAVILGMVYNFLPYMVIPLYSVMIKIDNRLIEAAQDLGCNAAHTFRHVVLPLSKPGIVSGITMTFVPAVSTFVITKLLGGGKDMLIGDVIELLFMGSSKEYNIGAMLSLLLMVLMIVCMTTMRFVDNQDDEMEGLMV